MERISAACAMEWSIELEKALRSKKPGQAIEGIQRIGKRIQEWSKEPKPTVAVYNMFGLVPGEDRLFANTILLRLADAFRFGDRETRVSIVKVFLLELKSRDNKKMKGKLYRGILSKERVQNHVELLKRVKIVFDTGDVESKALALALFGCWAPFAKDSAHIRYLILSSMISSDVLQVQASLFAAGCFCELVGDFVPVVLEMLVNMVTSSETLLTTRLAGTRVFAKMGPSYSVASRAYKTGLNLLDSLEEDLVVTMLVSLTKLASKSTLLLLEQVDLLLLFLSQEKDLRLQATALRCLHFIFMRGGVYSSVSALGIKTLSRIADKADLPLSMQCEALQILHKMLLYRLQNLPQDNMLELSPLLTTIENSAESFIMSKSLLAIHVLADLSMKLSRRAEMGSGGNSFSPLLTRTISIIIDRVILVVKPLLVLCQAGAGVPSGSSKPAQSFTFFGKIVKRQERLSVPEIFDFKGENVGISLKLAYYVHKFSVSCIEIINEAGAITTQVVDKVKLLVQSVHRCSLFHWYVLVMYSILMHSHSMWSYVVHNKKESCNPDSDLNCSLCSDLVEREFFTLDCAKKLLTERDNWSAYKAGTFAACQGAWITAAFVFEQLTSKAQSGSCSCWLKSLTQFAQTESKFQFYPITQWGFSLADWSKINEFPVMLFQDISNELGQGAVENIHEPNYTEMLLQAYHGLCSSRKTLESIVTSNKSFCFQRWFLAIRVELLGTMENVVKVLGATPITEDEYLNCLRQITQSSFRLNRLVQEYDLISMSFIGMDSRSSKIISTLALSCFLLAFATGFAILISDPLANDILMPCDLENSKNYLQGMLVQNVIRRLWHLDQDTISHLCLFLGIGVQPKDNFHESRSQRLNISGEERDILDVCNYVVAGIVALKEEANRKKNEEILSQVTKDGFQLLLNTITKWMRIPFRVPTYFFKIRPCIGSELFVFNADTRNSNQLSILPGFNLSLNLCLQLRNLPPDLPFGVTRSYCVLYSSMSFQDSKENGETKGQFLWENRTLDSDNLIQMNEKLLHHVTECSTKKTTNSKRGREKDIDSDEIITGFACFDLIDARKGFSNCLLDVSRFPVGSYRIKWQSCCIDSQGSYWSLLPLNAGPVFTVQKPTAV
ncbi:C1ORF73 PROTEIN [Salix purpurea]|uniref:C1ORF73 PROTEIN n=1 Tax=Salix purpurea TaxID=77065 RepID=A0A9Q0UL19_SALPP|nr:C1ORF73 PROTEIN [Salix purpurea]